MVEPRTEPPSTGPSAAALASLRLEAAQLEVEDILALCFAFSKDPRRLKVYLDVLRGKGGAKSQAAACLICFDLARRGDPSFEKEFMGLIPVLRDWADPLRPELADRLLGDNPYLRALWADLKERVLNLDARAVEVDVELVAEDAETVEVSLLGEADLKDLGLDDLDILSVDDTALRAQWEAAVQRFCALNADAPPGNSVTDGFYAEDKKDLERLDRFRQDALSLQDGVHQAKQMLPIIELFLASHTRARTLFGTRNKIRDNHLREGLEAFTLLPMAPDVATAWLTAPTAAPFSWEKVAEMLLDYVAFLGGMHPVHRQRPPGELVHDYLMSNRPQPPPALLRTRQDDRRRRGMG